MNSQIGLSTLLILIATFLLYSTTGVFLKLASNTEFLSWEYLTFFALIIGLLGIYAVLWQMILKKIPLSQAFLFKSMTVVFSLVYACLLFKETLSCKNILGAVFVIMGIIINSKSQNAL